MNPDYLAEWLLRARTKRKDLDPPIPIVSEEVDGKDVDFDLDAYEKALAHFRAWDIVNLSSFGNLRQVLSQTNTPHPGIKIPSVADDVGVALLRFRKRYDEDFSQGKPVFVDMGSYDARVTIFASLLGYRAYGIERDSQGFEQGRRNLDLLCATIPELERPNIVRADYTKKKAFRELGLSKREVSVFYNYDDNNVERVAAVVERRGERGAKLLLHTQEEYRDSIGLELVEMIQSQEYFPDFDVFRRG